MGEDGSVHAETDSAGSVASTSTAGFGPMGG